MAYRRSKMKKGARRAKALKHLRIASNLIKTSLKSSEGRKYRKL